MKRRPFLRAAEGAGPSPEFQEGPRQVGLRTFRRQCLLGRLAGGELTIKADGGLRAVLGVERKRGGHDRRQVPAPRVEQLLRDAAEPAATGGLTRLADLQERERRPAHATPFAQFTRGGFRRPAASVAEQHPSPLPVGEQVKHFELVRQRPANPVAGRSGERQKDSRINGLGVRRDRRDRSRTVWPTDEEVNFRVQRRDQFLQSDRGFERRDVGAPRFGRHDQQTQSLRKFERPGRTTAEDTDERDRRLDPAAKQKPVVMRLAQQAVGKVPYRLGRGVDEQPDRPLAAGRLRQNFRPLLRVFRLPQQDAEQILAELPGGVRRQVRALGEVGHPFGDAGREFDQQITLGVAEVLGEQFRAELLAVLRNGQADVIRGGHGVVRIQESNSARSRTDGSPSNT